MQCTGLREVISSPWYSSISQSVSGIRAHLLPLQPRFQQCICHHDFIVSVLAHGCWMWVTSICCLCCKAHECSWDLLPHHVALQQDGPHPLNFTQSPKLSQQIGYFSNLLNINYILYTCPLLCTAFLLLWQFSLGGQILDIKFLL